MLSSKERTRAAVRAEGVVEGEVLRFTKWWDSLDVVPLIKTLRQQAEDPAKAVVSPRDHLY